MEPGDVVELLHDSGKEGRIPLGCKLVVESAPGAKAAEPALMFRVEDTQQEYMYMKTDGSAGCNGDASVLEAPYRQFEPLYHAKPDERRQHVQPVVSLRNVAAANDKNARAPTMGTYIGMKHGELVGMVGLGADSRFVVNKVGHAMGPETPRAGDAGELEPKTANKPKHEEHGSFAAKGVGKHSMGRGA